MYWGNPHWKKPPSKILIFNYISNIINKWRKDFCLISLDKNPNTWALMCPLHYLELTKKEFLNTRYYEKLQGDPKIHMEQIHRKYISLFGTDPKYRIQKNWKLGRAYVLPKNKDMNQVRSLVSFYNWISSPLADKIARALSVCIRTIVDKKLWNTMELPKIVIISNDFPTQRHPNLVWSFQKQHHYFSKI